MGVVDNLRLSRLWQELKEVYAPKNHSHAGYVREVSRTTISVPASGWTAAGGQYEKTLSVSGLLTTDDVDIEVTGDQASSVVLLGGRQEANGQLVIVTVAAPTAAFNLLVVVHRKVV